MCCSGEAGEGRAALRAVSGNQGEELRAQTPQCGHGPGQPGCDLLPAGEDALWSSVHVTGLTVLLTLAEEAR